MKRAAVFLADGFEEMEAIAPVDLLRRAGVHCDLVSVQQGRSVTGTQGITLVADGTLEGLSGDYDLLLLPGGMPGVLGLTRCEPLLALLREQAARDGLIAAICAAPLVLAKAGLLEGKRVTAYPGYEHRLEHSGAIVTGTAVERDGKLITARSAGVAFLFGYALVEALGLDAVSLRHLMREEA